MMKGSLLQRLKRAVLPMLLVMGFLFITPNALANPKTVLIIKSNDNSFFNTTINQILLKTKEQINYKITTLDSIYQDNTLISQSQAIITLGITAANYPFKDNLNIPVIHSYITELQDIKHLKQKNHHSVLLDQPLQRYLEFIKYLLDPKSIGIISNTKDITKKNISEILISLDLKLEQRIFKTGDNPLNLVRDLLQSNDVLLSLPNPEVYNRQSLKGILLSSYRQNKPVISYSPAHVKSGALASIFSSPKNIGNQIAGLLNRILTDKFFKPEKYYYASEFDININHRVAKSLGLTLARKEKIIDLLKKPDQFR